MRKYRRQVVAGLVFIALALIGVVVITGADQLVETLKTFPAWLFLPVLLLKFLNWTLRYFEWRYYLGVIGVKTKRGPVESSPENPVVRERDSAVLWLAGMSLSISPGKVAEVLKPVVLKNMTGVEISRTLPVILMERLVDGMAVILLAAGGMFFAADNLKTGDLSAGQVRTVLAITTAAMLLLILIVQYRPLSLWLLEQSKGWPLIRRLYEPLHKLYDSTYELLRLRNLIIPLLLGGGAYFLDSIGFYILLRGLGADGSWTLLAQTTFILGFSVIIAALSAMPGGAGGRELTIGALLSGVAGLSKADEGTATFLITLFQLWVGVLVGLMMIAIFRRILFPPSLEAEIAALEQQPPVRSNAL